MSFQKCGLAFLCIVHLAVAQTDRTGWTVSADSFQPGNQPQDVFDGNSSTIWHSAYSPDNVPLPHNITIDMKKSYFVTGLSYQPRQDGNSNGNIGQHQIQLSQDGTSWSSPVAIGAYLDDSSTKKTTFTTAPARYVRLIALTEAGNRGPWTSAAELNVFSSATYSAPPTSLGQWGPTIDFPIVPVAAAMLHSTGKVLTWSASRPDAFGGGPSGITQTATFDPASGAVSQRTVSETQHDMFCPGLSLDATGRPIVTGGNNAQRTSIYDPGSDSWIAGPNMTIARGYQSSATLSNGQTFIIGGSWSGGFGGKNGEIYNPASNTWTLLPGCPVAPMLTADGQGIYRQDNHGWLFGRQNGWVFQAGPSKAMNWYDTAGSGVQTAAGLRASDNDAMNGNAVMFDAVAGKILTLGGAPNYDQSPATANAHVVTIGTPGTAASVVPVGGMAFARAFHNSIVLPNGQVFIIGGETFAVPFSDDTAVMIPEMWDPSTGRFTQMNPVAIPRTYHSVALLMPDATVFSAGGGLCGTCATNHFDAQIYSPPYLFDADGSRAPRSRILSVSSSSVVVGASITANMDRAVESFALVRGGSVTHSVNTDQRRIPLTPSVSGLSYTVTVPADSGIALPGYWMLFAIDGAGVPSVAQTILISGA